jgi:hypothetical protein
MARAMTPEEKEAYNMMKTLMNKPLPLKRSDFTPGQMILFSYKAKFDKNPYDATPLIFVLHSSKSYTLGLNFHWIPRPVRKIFVEFVYKQNKQNIKKNLPLQLTYKMIKSLFLKFGAPAVRLYINKRISPKGVIVPQNLFYKAIDLRSESFIGISAEQAWAIARRKVKERKK